MSKTARFTLTKGQKILLWVVILLASWHFLSLYSVVDAFLMFCFGGKVPGTDIILSPNAVIIIMSSILGGGILLLAIRGAKKVLRHPEEEETVEYKPGHSSATHSVRASSAEPVATAAVATTVKIPHTNHVSEHAIPQFALQAIMANLPEIPATPAQQRWQDFKVSSRLWLRRTWQHTTVAAARWARIAWICCVIAYIVLRKIIYISSVWIAKQSVALWRRASPYLWQFDAWLGKQYVIIRKKTLKKLREWRRAIEKR